MKCNIFFKDSMGNYKGEKEAFYNSREEAIEDAERILSTLTEISEHTVSYDMTYSEDWDLMKQDNRTRDLTRNRYRYSYCVEKTALGFDEPATFSVPDLGIKLTTEYGSGLLMLKEVVRRHLEYLVFEEREFPPSIEVEDCYRNNKETGMLAVSLNPVVERRKQD